MTMNDNDNKIPELYMFVWNVFDINVSETWYCFPLFINHNQNVSIKSIIVYLVFDLPESIV